MTFSIQEFNSLYFANKYHKKTKIFFSKPLKMKLEKLFYFAVGVLCMHMEIYAEKANPTKYQINGHAIDESQQDIPYVNVLVYSESDSSLTAAEIADSTGAFTVKLKTPGAYRLQLKMLGYEANIQKNIVLNKEYQQADLGHIILKPNITQIEEVGVVGEKKAVEYKIDRKIINLDKLPNAAGGTLSEALEDVPSIKTDMDGNVLLRGSSNFKVYVDGKPSMLEPDLALKQIPADAVEKVELITNPSAKYDADGDAGIINIVMKKNRATGFNALAHASFSSGNKYSGDLLMNYKLKKVNFFLGLDSRRAYFSNSGTVYNEYTSDSTTKYEKIWFDQEFNRNDYVVTYGLDWDISSKNSMSITGILKTYPHKSYNTSTFYSWSEGGDTTITKVYNAKDIAGKPIRFTISDIHKFNDEGHELSTYAFIGLKTHYDHHNYHRDTILSDNTITDTYYYKRETDRPETEGRLNITYTYPLSKDSKIETGYNLNHQYTYYQNFMEARNGDNEIIETNTDGSDLDYTKQEQAAFINYNGKSNKLSYQIGVRAEYYKQYLQRNKEEKLVNNEKLDWFPSGFLQYEFNDNWQINLNYSRRMNRLSIYDLSPIIYFDDGSFVYTGNPDLVPSYSQNGEIELSGKIPLTTFNLNLFIRNIENSTYDVTEIIDDRRVMHPENIDKEIARGAETSFDTKVQKIFKINYSASFYQQIVQGIADQDTIDQSGFNWDIQIRPEINFKTNTRIQFSLYYVAPSVFVQRVSKSYFVTNTSIKQSLLKDQLTITFRVRDIFKTRKYEYYDKGSNFYSENVFIPESPIYTLSVSYNLNSFKSKRENIQDSGSGGGSAF